MMTRARLAFGGVLLALSACNALLGIDEAHQGAPPADAGAGAEAVAPMDAADVGTTITDATNAGPTVPASDGSDPCAQLLTTMLSAPLTPPSNYASLNFTKESSGLTIDEANAAGCATLTTAASAGFGGYRIATWGGSEGVEADFNVESRVIHLITVGKNYKGTVQFMSRPGGRFGIHTYEIGIGRVLRDHAEMPISWDDTNYGTAVSSSEAWATEIYDGLLATFSPNSPSALVDSCVANWECTPYGVDGSLGLVARALGFSIWFAAKTHAVDSMQAVFNSGAADCSTPTARLEAMDYASIWNRYGNTPAWSIGGLDMGSPKPDGLTSTTADVAMCGRGKSATAPDPGYGAIQWGPMGEVLLEYNTTTNVGYRLFARDGYKGTLSAQTYQADGNTVKDTFEIGIGTMTKNGAPFTVDWAHPVAAATELSNAIDGATNADCTVVANACAITADDGQGHGVLDFPSEHLTLVFPKGTSLPSSIYGTWLNGK